MDRKIYNEIKNLQEKLNRNIEKHGLQDEETIKISNKIDELINYYYLSIKKREYPLNSKMRLFFDVTYESLKQLTIENGKFPEVAGWNKYAKKNNLLSSESLKYISMLDWKYLKVKVNREINMKIF